MKKIIIISILSVLSLTGCFLISKDVDEAEMKRDMLEIINTENEDSFNNEKTDNMCYIHGLRMFLIEKLKNESIEDEELKKNLSDELCLIEKEDGQINIEEKTYRKDFGDIELPKEWNNGVSGEKLFIKKDDNKDIKCIKRINDNESYVIYGKEVNREQYVQYILDYKKEGNNLKVLVSQIELLCNVGYYMERNFGGNLQKNEMWCFRNALIELEIDFDNNKYTETLLGLKFYMKDEVLKEKYFDYGTYQVVSKF